MTDTRTAGDAVAEYERLRDVLLNARYHEGESVGGGRYLSENTTAVQGAQAALDTFVLAALARVDSPDTLGWDAANELDLRRQLEISRAMVRALTAAIGAPDTEPPAHDDLAERHRQWRREQYENEYADTEPPADPAAAYMNARTCICGMDSAEHKAPECEHGFDPDWGYLRDRYFGRPIADTEPPADVPAMGGES